jgi:hypothetical protein
MVLPLSSDLYWPSQNDAIFYLQIAFHFVGTGESISDGITPTNGYHPLRKIFNIATRWLML